jgi:Domain of unknown function (DUF6647)
MAELLSAITLWLAFNFGLPPAQEPPQIVAVPENALSRVRNELAQSMRADHRGVVSPPLAGTESIPGVHAFYDDRSRTVYLDDDWRSESPADTSLLVHEMVHHLQNASGMIYPCPAAREKLAYQAQEAWLRQFGQSLYSAFAIDPVTRLVRTTCAN